MRNSPMPENLTEYPTGTEITETVQHAETHEPSRDSDAVQSSTHTDQPSNATTDESEVLFADLGIDGRVLAALSDVGYEKPSPIQAATIPLLLEGRDVVGLAQTGTGKTGE